MGLVIDAARLDAFFADVERAPQQQALLADIGQELAEAARLCFVDGKTPWGAPWAPLKLRRGQPLRDTGRLMNSISYVVLGTTTVEVGSDVHYASTHQFGATIKAKDKPFLVFQPRGFAHPIFAKEVTVPPRPFLPIDPATGAVRLPDDQVLDVGEVVNDYLRTFLA